MKKNWTSMVVAALVFGCALPEPSDTEVRAAEQALIGVTWTDTITLDTTDRATDEAAGEIPGLTFRLGRGGYRIYNESTLAIIYDGSAQWRCSNGRTYRSTLPARRVARGDIWEAAMLLCPGSPAPTANWTIVTFNYGPATYQGR
jgi:hypothetical protein